MLMRAARPKQPYNVHDVDWKFFKNYDNLQSNFASIRPGRKIGDPVVTDIRGLLYTPAGEVQYKLRHPALWSTLPCRRQIIQCKAQALYKASIAVTTDKHKHLQELKAVIPESYHAFYNLLKHE